MIVKTMDVKTMNVKTMNVKTEVGWCEITGDQLAVGPTEPFDPLVVLDWTSRDFEGAVAAVSYLAERANQCCLAQGKSDCAIFVSASDNTVHASILSTVCSDWSSLEGQELVLLQLSPSLTPCAEQKGPPWMHSGVPFSRLALMAHGAATGAYAAAEMWATQRNIFQPVSPVVFVVGHGRNCIVSCHAAVRPPQMQVSDWLSPYD